MLSLRLGMHLLFYGKEQTKLLRNKKVEELLHDQSVKVSEYCYPSHDIL